MISRIITALVMLVVTAGNLIDSLPRKYCLNVDIEGLFLDIQTRHVVYFWNEDYMEYRQYNSRMFLPWWFKRSLTKVKMLYNPCWDAPQPYVLDRNLTDFLFSKEQFAAVRHFDVDDTLQFVIDGKLRKLRRCKGPWDKSQPQSVPNTDSKN